MDGGQTFRILTALQIVCMLYGKTDAACTMPEPLKNQRWDDSNKGVVEFTTWKMTGWTFSVENQVVDDWEVVDNINFEEKGFLALRSLDTFTLTDVSGNSSTTYYSYMCLKFTAKSSGPEPRAYVYYQLHDREPLANNERVIIADHDGLSRFEEICDESYAYSSEEFRMMIREGEGENSREICPNAVLGRYDYVFIGLDGTRYCENADTTWDVCANKRIMTFNYTACDTKMAYSAGGRVACVHSVKNEAEDVTFTLVYNLDENVTDTDTFKFSCFASESDNSESSLVPGGCMSGQKPDEFAKDKDGMTYGARITATADDTCPEKTSEDGDTSKINVPLVIGLSVGGLVLIIIILIALALYCTRRK